MAKGYESLKKELSEREQQGDHKGSVKICREALKVVPSTDSDNLFYFGIKLAALFLADDHRIAYMEAEGITVLRQLESATEPKRNPGRWAAIQVQLGAAMAWRELGNKLDNIKTAISHYESALEVYDRNQSPRYWASTKVAAGDAYWLLGDSQNRAKAQLYYEEALTVFTPEAFPEEHLDYLQKLEERRASSDKAVP